MIDRKRERKGNKVNAEKKTIIRWKLMKWSKSNFIKILLYEGQQ